MRQATPLIPAPTTMTRDISEHARCSGVCVKRRCSYLPKREVTHASPLVLGRYSQRAFSFEQGRMRVIKTAVERMRNEIAQVFFAQFAHCAKSANSSIAGTTFAAAKPV